MKAYAIVAAFMALLPFTIPRAALAYPNGTPAYVTNTGPFCASCHCALKAEYMPELPAAAAENETPEKKHYALARSPMPSPYMELTDDEREAVIRTAREIDSNSSVSVEGPRSVKRGETVKVTVKARGGNGPAIGLMLVDEPLRFQASPVSASGWEISAEPAVKGQDGKAQTAWIDKRARGLKRNLNFVIVFDQKFDLQKKVFPAAEVSYTLKAPSSPGRYTVTAAFLYGTENTDKAGFFQRPSGRILFSEPLRVSVE